MDINSIRYFVAAADNRSFTAAARCLYVSQPSVSKKIAELESELNLTLFYRNGRAISLTPAGSQLIDAFKTMLGFFDDIQLLADDINSAVTGKISLEVPQFIDLSRSIPGFFSTFYNDNPGINVRLKYESRRVLINNFLEGKTDGSIFLSFDAELLQEEIPIKILNLPQGPHRILYSPKLFSEGFQPTISSFESMTFLYYDNADDSYNISFKADDLLNTIGFKPKYRMTVNSLDALLFYVSEGIGVSISGPSFRVGKTDKISEMPINHKKSLVNLCLCWKEGTYNPAFFKMTDALNNWCRLISNEK